MTTDEMITELRLMQKQIIHGTAFFGNVANRLEALHVTDQFEAELEEKNKTIENFDSAQRRLMDENSKLTEENKRLREALEKAIRILKAEFGDVNWRIKDINNALTKPI